VSAVDAHLRYYERGYEVLKNLEPYLQHALAAVDTFKRGGLSTLRLVG
jgi:hypothetical protein